MQRRGQFYVFDAFFAAAILFLGIGFLITEYAAVPDQSQTQVLAFDVAESLTATTLDNIFTNYTIENWALLTGSYTPAQQIQVWWHNASCTWCMANATALVTSLIEAVEFNQHGINITLRNDTASTTVYSLIPTKEADLMIVNQQILLTDSYGPDTLEVRVWR